MPSSWSDQFARSYKYHLGGKYDVSVDQGKFYVFNATDKSKGGVVPIYVPAGDIDQVDGFGERKNLKGGARRATKKARGSRKRAGSRRR